ncbi:ABC transporter ATP-binding protein/permease, partial [Bacillus sp. JJ1764]|uniref:ABC transporter ATP-binding protein/permease n=1 Tax=Bacillus sp. JJ1764 TaxID=3122964 RepID=UPI002FFEBA0E
MNKDMFTYKGAKTYMTKLVLFTTFQSGFIIIQAYCLSAAISSLFRGDLFHDVIKYLAAFLLALMLRQLITIWKKRMAFHFAASTGEILRKSLLQKIFQLGPRFVKNEGSGQTVTLVMEGIVKFRRYLEIIYIKSINMLLIPMAIVLFILFENLRSAIVLILAMPILIIFMILLGLAAKSKADKQFDSYQALSNHFVDSLRGVETLKYLGLSKAHIDRIALVSERYRSATMAVLKVAFLSSFALDFFTMLSIATVAVFLGIGLIDGSIGLQSALTILILAPEYFLPVRELGADYHATLDGKNAESKIKEILSYPSLSPKESAEISWQPNSAFSATGICYQFPDHPGTGLKDLNFTISGAKKIGIIGASGAGKSTFIDLLSGFLPHSLGNFQLNGQSIATLTDESWQNQITYIPQHPYIFNDTI